MMVLIMKVSQTALQFVDPATASDAGEKAVETAGRTQDLVVNTISLGDPLAITLWFIAVLAFTGIWYHWSKPPYAPRDHRKGPFCRLRDAITNSVSVFLP